MARNSIFALRACLLGERRIPAHAEVFNVCNTTLPAVIYARYSCDAQTEQSIEGQLRVCEDYAKTHDILILDTYIDRAMSGTNDMRPDFQRMIRDSAKRQWSKNFDADF